MEWRPQQLTRTTRGNQLSVLGGRQIPLCAVCDGGVLSASPQRDHPVSETYRSVYLLGRADEHLVCPSGTTPPQASGSQKDHAAPPRGRPPRGGVERGPVSTRSTVAAAEPGPTRVSAPTVRQAIEAFLAEAPAETDRLAMMLLGQHLGPSRRVSELGTAAAASDLARWHGQRWGSSRSAATAAAAIAAAAQFWLAQGWLSSDLAAVLGDLGD